MRHKGITTVPRGATVQVVRGGTAQRGGTEYKYVTYNGLFGYVKSAYITEGPTDRDRKRPALENEDTVSTEAETSGEAEKAELARYKPKAGFELEFNKVYVLPADPEGALSKQLLTSASEATATSEGLEDVRDLFREAEVDESVFAKRTVLFRAPNRTWAATTDTTFKGIANLEIVGEALTPDELDTEEAVEDQACLEKLFTKLKAHERERGFVQRPKDLADELGLVDVKEDVVFVNTSGEFAYNRDLDWHLQLTQATQLPTVTEPEPSWWLAGLNYRAMPVLEQIVTVMKAPSYSKNNPKNLFKESLPKTSVATLLGKTTEKDETKIEEWLDGMAERFDVALDDEVGTKLVNYSKGLLVRTGFTWGQFFTDLLTGTDRMATWSAKAFGGTEDFGYGRIDDPDLPANWYVHERRTVGSKTPKYMWEKQHKWAKETRGALKALPGLKE